MCIIARILRSKTSKTSKFISRKYILEATFERFARVLRMKMRLEAHFERVLRMKMFLEVHFERILRSKT